jgi:5-methylthioadenosine/S-adenosylhomocysteine deaminase
MENRKLLTVDEGHILSEAKRAIAEMKELRESESDE